MERKTFKFSKESDCYLYGYTERAVRIAIFLREEGFRFCGYIDRNARQLNCNHQLDILASDELNIAKESVIIVTCASIVTQHAIVKGLADKGYRNLIFMAAGNDYAVDYAKLIRATWEKLDRGIAFTKTELPCYEEVADEIEIIEKNETEVVMWLPVELLYTKPSKEYSGGVEDIERVSAEMDTPIMAVKRVIRFFDCIIHHKVACTDYADPFVRLLHANAGDKFLERRETLRIWDRELARGMDYFIDAAIKVKWSSQGFFYVLDGMHRSLYLLYKGFTMVPACVSVEDYELYYNRSVAEKMLLVQGRVALPHPMFYGAMLANKERSFLLMKLEQLFSDMYIGSFFDMENVDGYWAFAFKRYGIERVACLAQGEAKETIEIGRELFRFPDVELVDYDHRQMYLEAYEVIFAADTTLSESELRELQSQGKQIIYDCKEGIEGFGSPIFHYISNSGELRMVICCGME